MKCVKCGGEVLNGICQNCSKTKNNIPKKSLLELLQIPIHNPLLIVIILLLISVVCTLGGVYIKMQNKDSKIIYPTLYIYEDEVSFSSFPEKTLLGSYKCLTMTCNYLNTSDYNSLNVANNQIIIYDNSYFLYNYKENKTNSDLVQKIVPFSVLNNEYFAVMKDNLYGIIDKNGATIVDYIYSYIGMDYSTFEDIKSPCSNINIVCDQKEKNVVVKKDNKYGIINYTTGDKVLDYVYDGILINESLVKENSSWYLINATGDKISTGFSNIVATYNNNIIITVVDNNVNIVNLEGVKLVNDVIPISKSYIKNDLEYEVVETWLVINKENTIAIAVKKVNEETKKIEKDVYHYDYVNNNLAFVITTTD